MRRLNHFVAALLLIAGTGNLFSQVEIDQSIQLTGGTGQSSITGIVDPPVNGTDAVNKDYVDAAVAATGGSVPWTKHALYNSGGTFTVPSGITLVKIHVWGAGGGGGSGHNSSTSGYTGGGGGGGGGYSESIETVSPGESYTVTVGSGGNGGAVGANPGGNGGTSSFVGPGISMAATGGNGGQCASCVNSGGGGDGGYGSGGTINISLGSGGAGGYGQNTLVGQSGTNDGGRGGTRYGGGGGGGVGGGNGGNYSLPGSNAIPNTGAGGGGGPYNTAGGNGAAGKVIVYW